MANITLRIASVLAFIELVGHTWLILGFVPKHGPDEVAVVTAMKSHQFSFSGFNHTYWDLYFGYCLFVSISLVVESGVLWQLGKLAGSATARIRPIVGFLALGEAGYAVLMYKYFFIIPIAGHSAMTILLVVAFFTLSVDPAPSFPSAARLRESPAP
jgi:hypothetical protein